MKTTVGFACVCLGLLPSISVAVPTVYAYTGTPYTEVLDDPVVPGSYTSGMRLTASVTLDQALPADQPLQLVADSQLLSFSFNDGRYQVTNETSGVRASFFFQTDSSGGVKDWHMGYSVPSPVPGAQYGQAESHAHGCNLGVLCDETLLGILNPPVNPADAAASFVPGKWTITPVPEPSTYALFAAGVLLVLCASRRRRKLRS